MFDKFHEECAVVGIQNHPEAANMVYLGLYALQHRGQESSGIVSSDGEILISHRQMGLVADVFKEDIIKNLHGASAIGHNRYSTSGQTDIKNAQPFVVEYANGPIAVSHNGNLINANQLRQDLEAAGSIFQSTSDTEVIIHLIATSREQTLTARVIDALRQVKGSYSLVFLTADTMIAARDPVGFRPLILGRFPRADNSESYVVASETCVLDLIEAEYVREVEPGEVLVFSHGGMESLHPFPKAPPAPLHLRVHLLFPARQQRLRPQRLPVPQGAGPPACPGKPRGRGPGDPGARLRRARRPRLRRTVPHPAGPRAHP